VLHFFWDALHNTYATLFSKWLTDFDFFVWTRCCTMLCVCQTTPKTAVMFACLSSGWATTTGRLLGPKVGNIINSLFTWSKQNWLFWRVGFYPANRSNWKSIQKALFVWKKAGPLKKPDHVNRL